MSIGDFAALSKLSPTRLRTYARSGLLRPAALDPDTADRYYSPAQLHDARLIDALRRAGISLFEIKLLLRDRRPDRLDSWDRELHADAERKRRALAQARQLLAVEDVRVEATQLRAERTTMSQLRVAGWTEVGQVRENNEDAIVVESDLIAVADGLGGAPGRALASTQATAMVAVAFTGRALEELAAAVRAANWVIWQRASSTAELDGMATTMCAAGLLQDDVLAIVNVGDTRAYLARHESLQRLTNDHTVTAEMVRRGELTEAEAAVHPHRHILTVPWESPRDGDRHGEPVGCPGRSTFGL